MKLFKILFLALVVSTLISCGGAEERKSVYLEKAKASLAAGDYDKARVELKSVLQIDPKDSYAYFQLGEVYYYQKEYKKSYANYLKADELEPELLDNKARLGNIYFYLVNDVDKTQEIVDFILEKDPGHIDGQLLQAGMLIKTGKLLEAKSIVEMLNKNNPSHINVALFLANIYEKDKNYKQAISIIDAALKENIGNIQLTKALSLYLVENKDYERAEEIFLQNLKNFPDVRQSYVTLAVFYNQIGEKKKSEEILRDSIKYNPDDENRYFDLVRFISAANGNDAAILELRNLISNNKSNGKLRVVLAEHLLKDNNETEAIEVYKGVINDFSEEVSGVEARFALSVLYIRNNDLIKAENLLEEAILISPNNPKVNLVRAKIALNKKDLETAILSLRVVTKETPENIEAYMLLVKAYRLEGNSAQVKSTLNSAYANNKLNPDALLTLSQYYLKNDINQAEKMIDKYNNIKVNDYYGLTVKAVILNQTERFTEAYDIANKLIKRFSNKPNGYLQSIPYLSSIQDKKTTILNLEKGYLSADDNRRILLLLTTLQLAEKKYSIVENRLLAEAELKPEDIELKVLLSKVYIAQKNFESAEKVLEEAILVNPKKESLYLLLSKTYQNNSKIDKSESILLAGKDSLPASVKIPFSLASHYEMQNNYTQAISIYREMYELNPENSVVKNNLASLLSDYSSLPADLELAESLADSLSKSDQVVFLDTVGWVYYKLGEYKKAVEYLQKVVNKMPEVNIFNYHLGMAYKMDGNKELAKKYLELSIANGKLFKELEKAEAALKEL